ncbi:MAG: cation-translocating P-type ATPase [Anaerolineae bacterium]
MALDKATVIENAYRFPTADVLSALSADTTNGLTVEEAASRLTTYGQNELPAPQPDPWWRKFLAQFNNYLTILLLIATVISFIVWFLERAEPVPYEALAILAIVILNAILGYVQEGRAEQAVAALQAMAAPQTRVLRGGQPEIIPAVDVVPGDILLLEEGDTIAADARVLESISLRVAEAALTGESSPVSKHHQPIDEDVSIGDQLNMVFSGTHVTMGRGRAVVTRTGTRTEIGKIAGTLQATEEGETPLQRELDNVGKVLGIIVIIIAVVIIASILLVDRITTWTEIVQVLLIGVSLAVAAVPEGLTAITTIVLSLGMQRMAIRNVIVRKLNAVETLGSTNVIATDKTGTLTKNEMTVRAIVTPLGRIELTGVGYAPEGEALVDGQPPVPGAFMDQAKDLLRVASLANNATLEQRDGRWTIIGDPTEGALIVAARKVGIQDASLNERFPRVGEVPFTSERKRMTTAHLDATGRSRALVAAKGAPDVILALCTDEQVGAETRPLTPDRRAQILADVDTLAQEALRTLGVAYRLLHRDDVTGEVSEDIEERMIWLGVVGMIDPPRPEAVEAVKVAHQAGVRIIMITGDHPITAAAIADELGIADGGSAVMTGAELQKIDDRRLERAVPEVNVFARVAPEHKLRIVRALKTEGDITAMTGDGVNDAPALKMADIGVAMGITGTDVAKGAADMILTDDNFASIVAAVEEGRSIFSNIQKFLRYLLSSNVGEVLTMFLGVLGAAALGLQAAEFGSHIVVPLLATQILWINLLTDAGPALALGLDPADPGVMRRAPRDPRKRVIDAWMWFDIVFVGVIMAAGTLAVMDASLVGGYLPGKGDMRYAQTMAFTTLVFFQLFNVFNSRSDTESAFKGMFSNKWIWIAILASVLLQVLVIYAPFLQPAFNTMPLTSTEWLVCIAVASTVLWAREIVKLLFRLLGLRRHRHAQRQAARGAL